MRKATLVKAGALLLFAGSAMGVYAALSKTASGSDWQSAAQAAPAGLMEQVVRDNMTSNAQIDAGKMKVWKILQPGQSEPLYLIDTRIANLAERPSGNPLCGALGCAFFGYVSENGHYRKVLGTYFDVNLPPHIPLFELTDNLQKGLPTLKVNQREGDRVRQFIFSFNGESYEVVETRLSPNVYQ